MVGGLYRDRLSDGSRISLGTEEARLTVSPDIDTVTYL
jgi:hypothetical protein